MVLSEKALWTIEFGNNYLNKNIKEIQKLLYEALDLLIFLHEILAEEKLEVEENEVLLEELIMKFYLHGLTVCKIGETYEFKSKKFDRPNLSDLRLIDLASILTVGRAQLETLLMYQHLYMNSSDKDEQKLRYFAWIYTALIQRSKTPTNNEKSRVQKNKDAEQMMILKEKMESLSSFQKLSPKQQSSLLENGSVKLFKHWNTIFEESGFSQDGIFAKFYYILSVYSHSEGLSVIQMKSAKYFINNEHNSEMTFIQTFSSLIMTAIMIKSIIFKYESVAKRFETVDEKVKHSIDFYAKMGTLKV